MDNDNTDCNLYIMYRLVYFKDHNILSNNNMVKTISGYRTGRNGKTFVTKLIIVCITVRAGQ